MKKFKLYLSLVLAVAMMITMFIPAFAEGDTPETSTPMVAGISTLSQKFTPFFYETAYDNDVISLTMVELLTTDRMGGIIYNAIEGETVSYNGTDYLYTGPANITVQYDKDTNITTYTAKMREDIKFSDGEPMTADDVIFTYYVYLDPSYVGATTLNSYPIVGLQNYRTQTSDDVYAKYNAMFNDIYAAGEDHAWSDADSWTQEQQDGFWATMKATWTGDVQAIVDYCLNNYLADYAEPMLGLTPDDVSANEGLKVAFGMTMWGFGELGEDGTFAGASGKTWTLEGEDFPAIEDYYAETHAAYGGDPVAYWETENADDTDVFETARGLFIGEWGVKDEGGEGGIPNIAGIKKLDDYTVEVKTTGYEAPAVYSIFGIKIAPLHYYGDAEQYDYENNKFGFPYGDLSIVESQSTQPMGAGPYKFIEYSNKTVYYEANESYYLGAPKTQYVQFKETLSNEMAPGLQTGTIDAGELTGSKDNFALVSSYNSNGELNGDIVTTSLVDNLGYGYIGMNADTMLVGTDPFSDESANMRKGIATVFAVYRDVAFDSYYGDAAAVINYPISNTSWAAPQPTDEDYRVAFSTDIEGNALYTSDMKSEDKYAKALEAAIGYLKAAGFTFDDASGKFTEEPEGAKLSYELIIPADGVGDHPSFALVTDAAAALESIGFTIAINDPANSNILWDSINAGTQEMWCAAWQATIDPDMYQVYHSDNVIGKGGSDSNNYHIALPELDALIMEARQSDDQAFRKATYKQALDLIVNQAVEIPAYQRQNSTIFSTERIDVSTITPDITTFYGWMREIEKLEMNANK